MAKYRFKTKEEFISDGLWIFDVGCPHNWNFDGEMNEYIGMDVPDDYEDMCRNKLDFRYNLWNFKSSDYKLKEEENKNTKYFPDLSKHIGRYLKNLTTSPFGGNIPAGEYGLIIDSDCVNFPTFYKETNGKLYSCTYALKEGYLDVYFELMPEGFEPEDLIFTQFSNLVVGKWYKAKSHDYYGKFLESSTHYKFISSCYIMENSFYNGRYGFEPWYIWEEVDINEIQKFLPDGHPDKIIPPMPIKKSNDDEWSPKIGDWIYKYWGDDVGTCEKLQGFDEQFYFTSLGKYSIKYFNECWRKPIKEEIPVAKDESGYDYSEKGLPEFYEYIGRNKLEFTNGKIYKCLNPNDLNVPRNFIDDNGKENGFSDKNYKYFIPSTEDAYISQTMGELANISQTMNDFVDKKYKKEFLIEDVQSINVPLRTKTKKFKF